jgi:hypothetical protein
MLIAKIGQVGDIRTVPQEPPLPGLTNTPSPSSDLRPDEGNAQQVTELQQRCDRLQQELETLQQKWREDIEWLNWLQWKYVENERLQAGRI